MLPNDRSYKAIIFDMDGVLVDSEILNIEIIEDYFQGKGINIDKRVTYSLVGASGDAFWSTLRDKAGLDMDAEVMRLEILALSESRNIPYKKYLNSNAVQLLERLTKQGYKLALASSTERGRVERVLERCDVDKFFQVVTTGDMFRESKPNPEIYLKTAERLSVTPAVCVAVEDSPIGIEAAAKAGMTVIAKREERFGFDQSRAHYIVDDLIEVADMLKCP